MSSRTLSFGIALASALAAPLAAAGSDGFSWVGGEAGFGYQWTPSQLTRTEVMAEVKAARRAGTPGLVLGQQSYVGPDLAPGRAGFASSREQAKQAAQLGRQRPNEGRRYGGGEADGLYIGP